MGCSISHPPQKKILIFLHFLFLIFKILQTDYNRETLPTVEQMNFCRLRWTVIDEERVVKESNSYRLQKHKNQLIVIDFHKSDCSG